MVTYKDIIKYLEERGFNETHEYSSIYTKRESGKLYTVQIDIPKANIEFTIDFPSGPHYLGILINHFLVLDNLPSLMHMIKLTIERIAEGKEPDEEFNKILQIQYYG
jgi:predicted RNA binding protein YcfA (HicA-like mRNA interferase family)